MSRGSHARLLKLWNKNPRCHWCWRVTFLSAVGSGKVPKLAATRDHIISRNNPRSRGHRGMDVLACYGCNQQRSRDEMAIVGNIKRMNEREKLLALIAESISASRKGTAMPALCCSRHNVSWTNPPGPALCPRCQADRDAGGKVAHHDYTAKEMADDDRGYPDDTPRMNYASTCGTTAARIEAWRLERELAAERKGRQAWAPAITATLREFGIQLDTGDVSECVRGIRLMGAQLLNERTLSGELVGERNEARAQHSLAAEKHHGEIAAASTAIKRLEREVDLDGLQLEAALENLEILHEGIVFARDNHPAVFCKSYVDSPRHAIIEKLLDQREFAPSFLQHIERYLARLEEIIPPPESTHHALIRFQYGSDAEGWVPKLGLSIATAAGPRIFFFDPEDAGRTAAAIADDIKVKLLDPAEPMEARVTFDQEDVDALVTIAVAGARKAMPRLQVASDEALVVTLMDGASAVFRPSCDIAREVMRRIAATEVRHG